jgi:quercetin dioxygenase-like cupin family protein
MTITPLATNSRWLRGFIVALPLLFLTPSARAEDLSPYQNLLTPLLQSGVDTVGQPIQYPSGAGKVTAAIVTVPPGGQTGWHSHEVPLFGYVLEGVLTVDYGSKGIKTYKAGDSWMEAMNWPHNGMNKGTVPVKLIAVYMGGGDKANTVKVPAP